MKKLFLIDWGKKCNGGRYAVIKSTREQLFWDIDNYGDPSSVKFREIDIGDEMLYLELTGIERDGREKGEPITTYAVDLNDYESEEKISAWEELE